ncbi:MAG TPA: hypothetical protein VF152_11470 [Acidimicrobiia bacterium]
MGYDPGSWDSFFVANAGAAAALAGLLFVGISINLATITSSPRLSRRALEAFVLLASVLILSAVGLTPGVSRTAFGWGVLGLGAIVWALVLVLDRRTIATREQSDRAVAPRGSLATQVALGQAATLPLLIGAVTLLADGGGGLYWVTPAVIFAYVAALANAWVLMIEIGR